jgi:translation initiation factor 2 subunit 2
MARLSIDDYKKLLDRALARLPKKVLTSERFVLPEPRCEAIGNRTVFSNFKEVSDKLSRPQQHLLKFLSHELATAGFSDGIRAVFQGRFGKDMIKSLLERYLKEYVICPTCSRPDTRIERQGRITLLVCDACGAWSSVRAV